MSQTDLDELRETLRLVGDDVSVNRNFLAELYLGRVRFGLLKDFPEQSEEDKKLADPWIESFKALLWERVNPNKIDTEGEISDEIIVELRNMGAFALKIWKRYGGLEFSAANYGRVMTLVGGWDGSMSCLISPPNSLGIATPIMKIGTNAQQEKYLRELANGKMSAFALTERQAGSDPTRVETVATRIYDDDKKIIGYVLNGHKLYTTCLIKADGVALAEYVAVFARIKKDEHNFRRYGLFIVPTNASGFVPKQRCHFMGYRAIYNGLSEFNDVGIPAENLIGVEGDGFANVKKCLDAARIGLPSLCLGGLKQILQKARWRCRERVQWKKAIYKHQDVAKDLVNMACATFAAETVLQQCYHLADRGINIEIETNAAKFLITEDLWASVDALMRVLGGIGFETYNSQKARGEIPVSAERHMRDAWVNKNFEGTNAIMQQLIQKEGSKEYLRAYMMMQDSNIGWFKRMTGALSILPIMLMSFCGYFFTRIFFVFVDGMSVVATPQRETFMHRLFIRKEAYRLALNTIRAGMHYGVDLRNQNCIGRQLNERAMNLWRMALVLSYAASHPEKQFAWELADFFCHKMREEMYGEEKISGNRWIISGNHKKISVLAEAIVNGKVAWLEEGILSELKKEGVDV